MSSRLDVAGAAVAAAAIVWALVAAALSGGNPLPLVGTLLVAGLALAIARMASATGSPLVPMGIAGIVALLVLLSVGDLVRGVPGGSPLRYGNANAALYGQAGVAAAMLALWPTDRRVRIAGVALAAAFVAAVVLSRSAAAMVLLVIPVATLLVGLKAPRAAIGLAAIVFAGGVAVTTVVAATGTGSVPAAARDALGDPRLDLWRDGFSLMTSDPVSGVGPGRFALESPVASTSRSYAWAHNAWLHQGAETGVAGYALLVAIFLWGFARLWSATGPGALVALSAGGLAMVGAHASVDYVLHFPAVTVAAAALAGTGQGVRVERERRVSVDSAVRQGIKAAILPFGVAGLRGEGDVAILAYHRVGAGSGEISMPVELFDEQMAELADSGEVIRLDDVVGESRGGVVLTVDDGYTDFHEHVLPVLERHRLPLTLYLATGPVVARGRKRHPDALTWAQLREAVSTGLVTIGSHTHSHVDLGTASAKEARDELRRSRGLVEDRLGTPCRHFAYPFGVASAAAEREVRALYDTAALAWGTNRAGRIDPHRLARTPILRSDARLFFRAKVRGMLDGEAAVYRVLGRGPWRHGAKDGS